MENKATILIVDDLKDNRQLIKMALKREGYFLAEATNGQEALQKTIEIEPDVILMDAMMPLMDGYEAIKILREIKKFDRIPILMITALNKKEDMIKALEYGVNDFITKPFDKNILIARCKSYVNLSKINKQYILSIKNPQTKLPNKLALMEDIKECQNPKLTLLLIKDYELIETFYGEQIAEKVVKAFASNIFDLVADICKDAELYHINEGEFALLKDDANDEILKETAYKNCRKLQKSTKNRSLHIDSYCDNISLILSYAHNSQNIFENARIGIKHAINSNKSIVFADDIVKKIQKDAKNNIKIIKMIETALENDKVISYFQPIYNNKTKMVEKYESLVRIIDENDNVVSPFYFLEIAKRGRHYTNITKRVLQNSFKALNVTNKEISINIAFSDIEDTRIKEFILNFCISNPTLIKRVVFEFLEDENFQDYDKIIDFITKVKKYGAKIAIDDFGSGYSSFERILYFQPDILKIDGTLIKNIHEKKLSKNIVETIQNFATKVNIKTVAEFVHNKEVFDIINKIGIDYTQGYYISEPKSYLE